MKHFLHAQIRKNKFPLAIRRFLFFLIFLALSSSFQTLQAQTGEALSFDGIDDYVDITGVPLSGSYTKEAWIYLPVVDLVDANGAHNIISGAITSLYVYHGKLGAGHNFNNAEDPTVLEANTWYHVAVTYDAATGTMILYKNGVAVATSIAPTYTESALFLGAIYVGRIDYFFQGIIDQVKIWNVVRTPAEIVGEFTCNQVGGDANLVAFYPFTQGIAGGDNTGLTALGDSIVTDPHNGILKNFALTGSTSNWIAAGYLCGTLPVQLSNFSVVRSRNGVELKWGTATEINNKGFQIQRSTDGRNNWKDVAFVPGAGNTNLSQIYSYTDLSPEKGINYYRLRQVNYDGKGTYSEIKSIRVAQLSQLILYPTLATSTVTLEVASTDMLNTNLSIYDAQGRKVQQERLINQKQQINISGLQNGMYLIKLQNGASERFVKQ